MGWTEVGDGCFARRYDSFDVTVGAVVGSDGVLVVDTRASLAEAADLRRHLRELTSAPVRWIVNTHWHFDHCFGNSEFTGAELWGHETVPRALSDHADTVRDWLADRGPEWRAAMEALVIAAPTRTVATATTVDLGDRGVELTHLGRGHTDGDLVAHVVDADVVYVGDLVEQSGPPAYGDDCFPLEWPATLGRLEAMLDHDSVVVPGHGDPVGHAFVSGQRAGVQAVAATISELAAAGVPVEDALPAAHWPFPPDSLAEAVRRGYAQRLG